MKYREKSDNKDSCIEEKKKKGSKLVQYILSIFFFYNKSYTQT